MLYWWTQISSVRIGCTNSLILMKNRPQTHARNQPLFLKGNNVQKGHPCEVRWSLPWSLLLESCSSTSRSRWVRSFSCRCFLVYVPIFPDFQNPSAHTCHSPSMNDRFPPIWACSWREIVSIYSPHSPNFFNLCPILENSGDDIQNINI